MRRFQPEEMLRVLAEHEVEFLVIGGIAATFHGSNLRTGDLDICPARNAQNLDRLAAALREMAAHVRVPGLEKGLSFSCDAETLSKTELLNLSTRFGDLDLAFVPSGTQGFEDLSSRRILFDFEGITIPVVSLEDLIRSKEATARGKDLEHLPTLRFLLEELSINDEMA